MIKVLLVEDNPGDVRLVRETFAESRTPPFELHATSHLADAKRRLGEEKFDALLLDLTLPDARGLEGLTRLQQAHAELPIVVLSGLRDEGLAVQAVHLGAQDYLVKGQGDRALLPRSIRYAIERKRAEREIEHLAQHDGLTELPNRRLLHDRLSQSLAGARRNRHLLGVLFLDLDGFKAINDTFGHAAGDLLLRGVASRLRSCTRESDTIARIGGDEFVLVLPEIRRLDDIRSFATKILEAIASPFSLGDRELPVHASIGISVYPNDGHDAESLLRAADVAMYRAKAEGGGSLRFYNAAGEASLTDHSDAGRRLQLGLARDEFRMAYQPLVAVETRGVVAMEALLRWAPSNGHVVMPGHFLPLAEATGLMPALGEWALRKACEQHRAWQSAGLPPFLIAVNLSSPELGQRNLPGTVARVLHEVGLHPAYLELQVTEKTLMDNEATCIDTLQGLSAMGVRLSVDDFGAGYSSLNHLREFPIDSLNIDRSFVQNTPGDARDEAILAGTIALAHNLDLSVTAEGVESEAQLDLLARHHCDHTQGYFFGPPMPPERVTPSFLHALGSVGV
jgi:diguanylate cyclase (GGDEF)-like protein